MPHHAPPQIERAPVDSRLIQLAKLLARDAAREIWAALADEIVKARGHGG